MFAAQTGLLRDVEIANIPTTLHSFMTKLRERQPELMTKIASTKALPHKSAEMMLTAFKETLHALAGG